VDKPAEQLSIVNRSGYALQIAVARKVTAGTSAHGWRVLYEEHSWRNGLDGSEGFIDLVLEHARSQLALLVECKRLQNKELIFLPRDGNPQARRYARALSITRDPINPAWADHPVDPRSPMAMFCVMPKDARDPPVERLGAELVSASEALLQEERGYLDRRPAQRRRIYFPAIVTTAQLSVCSFDPDAIQLSDGKIPAGAQFARTSVVRFTKQLSKRVSEPAMPSVGHGTEAEALASAKDRTVFIINAEGLHDFLNGFSIDGD
jgi:hypothetical protein